MAQRQDCFVAQSASRNDTSLASLDQLVRLETAGARIFFGHDGAFWKTVPQAPAAIT
jgi:hypothetical protein